MSQTRRTTRKPARPGTTGAEAAALEKTAAKRNQQTFVLRLYVTGATPASARAIARVREVCETQLKGRYQLEVIDIYQLPALARDEQIIATPTLLKVLPTPLRRYIGDLSKIEKVIFGLDLKERKT